MSNVFIFRINYNARVPFEIWSKNYPEHWDDIHVEVGDLIVVPKSIDNSTFSIATAKSKYRFSVTDRNPWGDFGHYIEVDNLRHYSYRYNSDSALVSSKFRAYQSAINAVKKQDVVTACVNLYQQPSNQKSKSNESLWSENVEDLSPSDFEKLIATSLEKLGYIIVGRNEYDGKGSDVDITAIYRAPFFSTYEASPIRNIELLIQIKKKDGKDSDFKTGVDQLVKARKSGRSGDLVLINTTSHVTEEEHSYALGHDVNVISGAKILRLIMTSNFNEQP